MTSFHQTFHPAFMSDAVKCEEVARWHGRQRKKINGSSFLPLTRRSDGKMDSRRGIFFFSCACISLAAKEIAHCVHTWPHRRTSEDSTPCRETQSYAASTTGNGWSGLIAWSCTGKLYEENAQERVYLYIVINERLPRDQAKFRVHILDPGHPNNVPWHSHASNYGGACMRVTLSVQLWMSVKTSQGKQIQITNECFTLTRFQW
jgi:hypothetical protein